MISREVKSIALAALKMMAITAASAMPTDLATAAVFELTPAESPVEFLATGKPGFLKIRGKGAHLTGKATIDGETLTGAFGVDLQQLKTGIELRDQHMKESYLETRKFPEAKLTLDPMKLDSASGGPEIPFTGKLTLKDKENPVKGVLSVIFKTDKTAGRIATGNAKFALKIADYPIGVPSHLGVTVADIVEVSLRFRANEVK